MLRCVPVQLSQFNNKVVPLYCSIQCSSRALKVLLFDRRWSQIPLLVCSVLDLDISESSVEHVTSQALPVQSFRDVVDVKTAMLFKEKIVVLKKICCVVVFFTLTDRASTILKNIRDCQSGTWSAGQELLT